MTLMESVRLSPDESRDGVPYPLFSGEGPLTTEGVGNVPLVPSGKERVEMSIDETAVVGFDCNCPPTCSGASPDTFRRGGSGGGGGDGDGGDGDETALPSSVS